jgi:hypothetical protein
MKNTLIILLLLCLVIPIYADSTPVLKSDTTHPHKVLVTSSTDHITGLTGQASALTTALRERKNSGSTITPTGVFTEEDSTNFPGIYDYTPAAGDVDTYGEANFHTSVTGSDPVDFSFVVVAYNPYDASLLGLTGVATASAQTTNTTTLNTVNTNVSALPTSIWAAGTRTLTSVPNVTIGGYASGQDPATLVLAGTIFSGFPLSRVVGDLWSGNAGPSTASYPDSTHQTTHYFQPNGSTGQYSTSLTTNSSGKPIARTYSSP